VITPNDERRPGGDGAPESISDQQPTSFGWLQRSRDAMGVLWLLRIPCDHCNRWHVHGAGRGAEPFERPGRLVTRSEHCSPRCSPACGYGDAILIQHVPFQRRWAGRFGAITPTGRRFLDGAR
jgi:hypothetical protein